MKDKALIYSLIVTIICVMASGYLTIRYYERESKRLRTIIRLQREDHEDHIEQAWKAGRAIGLAECNNSHQITER